MRQVLLVFVLGLLSAACTQRVYTPPTRSLALESAKPVDAGRIAIQTNGGYDSNVKHLSLRGRYGIYQHAELALEISGANISGTNQNDGNIAALRLQLKQAFANLDFISLTAGAGAGHSPIAGTYASIDSGIVASYENCTVVPFASVSGMLAKPFSGKESAPGANDAADTTWGLQTSLGLRYDLMRRSCNESGKVAILAGVGTTYLTSTGGLAPTQSEDETVSFSQALVGFVFNL